MSLLLKNALIIDVKSKHHKSKKNILIEDGTISSFSSSDADRIVDCEGKIVSPGWFDINADFCDPGYEYKEDLNSGIEAALSGGFTDVQLTSRNKPPITSKSDVEYITNKNGKEIDLYITGSLSEEQKGENLTEVLDMHQFGATSFGDGDKSIWNAKLLLKALQYTSNVNVPIFQNARERSLSFDTQMHEGITSTLLGLRGEPSLSEELIISRDLDILKYAGGKLHFTKISTRGAVDLIQKAKTEGLNVTCDVSIHHLLFNETSVGTFDTVFKSLPPFRSEEDREALIEGIQDGTIDAICSNHRPQDLESKQLEFDLADCGAIAIQTFLPSLLKIKGISMDLIIQLITHGARKVLGLQEVSLTEGSVAKLTIFDPEQKWVLDRKSNRSKSLNSPFWEEELTGKVVGTVNKGVLNIL